MLISYKHYILMAHSKSLAEEVPEDARGVGLGPGWSPTNEASCWWLQDRRCKSEQNRKRKRAKSKVEAASSFVLRGRSNPCPN